MWSHDGILCTGEHYWDKVKLTFAKGASLPNPSSLLNSSLEGATRRAIDFHEGDRVDAEALKDLIRAALALSTSSEEAKERLSGVVKSAQRPAFGGPDSRGSHL